jgi:hydrogenase large subunit
MSQVLKVGPLTRVEGHLEVEVTVDQHRGSQQVVDAKCSGTMFRGFEIMLQGRSPRDASHYTQRICGVCPISHGMASSLALEAAFRVVPPDNGRILQNIILASNYLQSHILHFYHLALPDYVDLGGALNMSPWLPRFTSADLLTGTNASRFVTSYVAALAIRRKAHQMGAIYGGKMPCSPALVPGGATDPPTADKNAQVLALLAEISAFIRQTYLPDVQEIAKRFSAFSHVGAGCRNLLAYGVFDLNAAGTQKLLKRGRYTNGQDAGVDPTRIKEYVRSSYYTANSGNRNPASGVTEPAPDNPGGYSWVKAPRYADQVHEVGPLARMWVNGDYRKGPSVIDRLIARALEADKVAKAVGQWVPQLKLNSASYQDVATPDSGSGIGLTEAPRGALGHWMNIVGGKISQYQIITPTAWNASPHDDRGRLGAMEQALVGTPVADLTKPTEILRVVHSFDPCLSCAVHMVRPGKKAEVVLTGV